MLHRKLTGTPPHTALPKGAVDTQVHLYLPGYPAAPGGSPIPEGTPGPAEYRQVMSWLGIERVIVTQGNAHQRDNANLLASLAAMGDNARGVAVIAGDTSDAELQRLLAAGVVGARIMDLPGGAIGLADLEAVDARAAAFDWCLAVQFNGSNILEHETRLAAIKSRWIFDHHGKFFAGVTPKGPEIDAVKRLIDGGRCWFKFAACYESSRTGGPLYEDIAAVAREIAGYAPERIVWGTNWPHNQMQTTASYPDDGALLDRVLGWLPDDRARQLALVDNPEQLFRLPSA